MDSSDLKNEALCFLRYGKRLPIVCTEAGRWNADVLGVSPAQSIEIEVKISKADLRSEFHNKRGKHWVYANADKQLTFVPNFFYFMVPQSLRESALPILAEHMPKAGLIVHQPDNNLLDGRNCAIIKPAEKLRDGKPSWKLIRVALLRMGSELCGTRLMAHRAFKDLSDRYRLEMDRITTVAVRASGILDMENREGDLDLRAAELVQCVDGLAWTMLTDEQKERWRVAAKKFLEAQYLDIDQWESVL